MCISHAAAAATGENDPLAHLGQVRDQGFVVVFENLRADRQTQDGILAVGPSAVLAHTVNAALGLEMLLIAVIDQGV